MKLFILLLVVGALSSCGESVRSQRAKWQNPSFFTKHRAPLYNAFVENGGMSKKQREMQGSEIQIKNRLNRELSSEMPSLREMPIAKSAQNEEVSVAQGASASTSEGSAKLEDKKITIQESDTGINRRQINALQSDLKQEPLMDDSQDNFISLKEIPR